MNSKLAITNIISSIILQVVTAISGLILPRFFISCYGSAINGMVVSITLFLSYLALVEAGISAAAVVELYKPLENQDEYRRNYILSAAKKFYLQSGILYTICLILLLICYPAIIGDQVSHITTVLMILVLAGSNLIDYFILGKYRVLLSADQKVYVLNHVQSIGTILNLIITLMLMHLGFDVVTVKLVATLIYALRSLVIIIYVKKRYKNILFDLRTKKDALPQRWSALFHQIVGVVCNNTDIILITLCMGSQSLIEASVYYVYNLAASMFTSFANSLCNAITPTFGKMYAAEAKDQLERSYDNFEFFFVIVIFTLYSCMFVLLLPFVSIYTSDVHDANYIRPHLALLFTVMGLVQNIRIPSLSMICAAGHYKQTRIRALLEALINLAVSIFLIFRMGIAGVVVGTICSFAYRSTDSIIYSKRFFDNRIVVHSIVRLARNTVLMIVLCYCASKIDLHISSWRTFFFNGIQCFFFCFMCFFFVNYLFEFNKIKQHFLTIKLFLNSKSR